MTAHRTPARSRATTLVALVLAALLVAAPGASADATGTPRPAPTPETRYVLPSGEPAAGVTRRTLVDSGSVVHDFAAPTARWGAGHRGVDLRIAGDAPVLAPQSGTVAFVGVVVDRPLVVITHPDGLRSTLEPVSSDLTTGTAVARGAAVGTLAAGTMTHCAPASCLHWGVRRGEDYVDPLALVVRREPVVLLPLRDRRSS